MECLKDIEADAAALMRIPASEQFIGHIQVAVSAALLNIKKCLEAIAKEHPKEK